MTRAGTIAPDRPEREHPADGELIAVPNDRGDAGEDGVRGADRQGAHGTRELCDQAISTSPASSGNDHPVVVRRSLT
ncbi:hypothetical protein [Nocardia jiangsuensis]|uniref:Uncharacterized protein n=1 Tax=Nocardia jiangsuensis TaxID=1691563 RepID=A0ABV8E1V7_9NOCA